MPFGYRLFPARFLFSTFLRRLAQSSRAIPLVLVVFRLVVHFHVPPRAGPASSGSASRPLLCSLLLCELRAAGGCASAEPGGAYFSSSFRRMLVVPRANRSFRMVFEFSRRRRESVCVCVCVKCWRLDLSIICSLVCIGPAGARSNHIFVRHTVHGVASRPPRPFSIVKSFLRLARGGLRFSDFPLCILFLHFPSFLIYACTYVFLLVP